MGILFTIITLLVVIINLLSHIVLLWGEGTPAKDKDILEALEKNGHLYSKITNDYIDRLTIRDQYRDMPSIAKTNKWFIFYSYSIEGVGVVPRWYKSKKVIDAKFKELLKGSIYDTNKRKKLGLD